MRLPMVFARIVLPLPLSDSYTFSVPSNMTDRVGVGFRVVVQFGAKKLYTGIVCDIFTQDLPEEEAKKYKPVEEVLDTHAVVTPLQLRFWQWLADYYMCSLGEVMKAALPSGMKVESETKVEWNVEFESDKPLPSVEERVLELMEDHEELTVTQLQKLFGKQQVLPVVQRLVQKGALRIHESLSRSYKPKTVVKVRLNPDIHPDKLHLVVDALERAPKQQHLFITMLDMLERQEVNDGVDRAELVLRAGSTTTILNQLAAKRILQLYEEKIERLGSEQAAIEPLSVLDDQQRRALAETRSVFARGKTVLLHGVTSSGKTEVYIHLIQDMITKGKQVLYLLPEIALTTQITDRLRKVFGDKLGVYHSKFPDSMRVEVYQRMLSDHPYEVVLGVRSSIFLPFRRLGLVIVDEEHETSFKQQDPAPRYHARNAALMLARISEQSGDVTHVLLGSATPSLEALHLARIGRYGYVTMRKRFRNVLLPQIEVVDIKRLKFQKRMRGAFSQVMIDAVREALDKKKQVILFQNRRGYSPFVSCHTCGWVPRCEHCDVSLTYHKHTRQMTCHYCGFTYQMPSSCPACGETHIVSVGMGTERLEEEVRELFPGARVLRMDLDTARSRSQYEKIISGFSRHEADILIGTQMVTKGLDFSDVTVVGVMDADTLLHIPDFRSYEHAYQMLSQVSGRAGRSGQQGKVILQTRQADSEIIRQVAEQDERSMIASQMAEREAFHYPPFYRLINIYIKDRQERRAEAAANDMAQRLRQYFGERLLGPDIPVVGWVQSLHIRKLMLKVETSASPSKVREILRKVQEETVQAHKGILLHFDVDPL